MEDENKAIYDQAVLKADSFDYGDGETNDTDKSLEVYENPVSKNGWYEVAKEIIPFGGKQYPASMYFNIRPADTPEIKFWSTLPDEVTDPRQILKYFNHMLEKCVAVENGSWDDIKVKDRLWFIFYLHEISFVEAERPLIVKSKCSHRTCEHEFNSKIDKSILQTKFPDSKYEKYINAETGSYDVKTKSYGTVTITHPTIRVDNAIMNYMMTQKKKWVEENEAFFEIASYLIKPHQVVTEKLMESIYTDYRSWNRDKFLFIGKLIEDLKFKPSEFFKVACPKCGRESDQAFDLEGGIKQLFFAVSDIDSELL